MRAGDNDGEPRCLAPPPSRPGCPSRHSVGARASPYVRHGRTGRDVGALYLLDMSRLVSLGGSTGYNSLRFLFVGSQAFRPPPGNNYFTLALAATSLELLIVSGHQGCLLARHLQGQRRKEKNASFRPSPSRSSIPGGPVCLGRRRLTCLLLSLGEISLPFSCLRCSRLT